MLKWQAHTVYEPGKFVIGSASGVNSLFYLRTFGQPFIVGTVDAWVWNHSHSVAVGAFVETYPTSTGSAVAHATGNSLSFGPTGNAGPIVWNTLNGAGETTGTTTPFPSVTANFDMVVSCSLLVPQAGQYKFTIKHHDGMVWGIGNGASVISGDLDDPITGNSRKQTAVFGYPIMGGTNKSRLGVDHPDQNIWIDDFTINFPEPGIYPIEVDYDYWFHSGLILDVKCNGYVIAPGPPTSGTTEPTWPAFSTANAPSYATVTEQPSGQFVWSNLGPTSDFAWHSNANFVLPGTNIVDPNGNIEAPFRTGLSGSTLPTFSTILNQLTLDNPNLIWINDGSAADPPEGTVSARNGGYEYGIALVNTLDDTVSNLSPLSARTGNFVGAQGISFAPGEGLPPASEIDPQADYVAIFRTTDGFATPFLINGELNSLYTMPLSDYLKNGFTDTSADTDLNNLVAGANGEENTPPGSGAANLTYHLNRIFFSIGNVVYWTAGPDTPVGNGVNGVPPLNFAEVPSAVKRLVPSPVGMLVFTVSDIYVIPGQGTSQSPLLGAQPFLTGLGIESYNALDVNGSIIGIYTTDKQFVILDPSVGVSYAGFPIGDKLRKSDGNPGTNWVSPNVYVTWHVEGEDQAWYVADGQYGWYRLMPTPAPEIGFTWSPFAAIQGGCKAVQSVEVSPGVHKLLVGPYGTAKILQRDLAAFLDNTTAYAASAVIGSAVLAQPGQVATVSFITTESVNVGTPLTIGILINEALPYYVGSFETLTNYCEDPPGLPDSTSLKNQRFYLSELETQQAVCRHMQIQVSWPSEAAANELLSLTVFGGLQQEN